MISRYAIACAALFAAPAAAEGAAGATFGATYVTDVLTNLDGGLRHGTAWLGRADATAEIDGASFGLPGATLFLDLMFTHGSDFSGSDVGDAQVVSNVQAERALRPIEAWLAVPLGSGGLSAKAGLVDLNTEFDVQEVGAFFLNSSHGVGPEFSQSGLNGPSIFPATSVAMLLRGDWTGWSARLGLFDAIAGRRSDPRRVALRIPGQQGALVVGEVDVIVSGAKVQLGVWTYTSRFDAIAETLPDGSPRRLATSRGAYAMVEGRLTEGKAAALDGWMRLGLADARVNPIGAYVGGGLTYGNDERCIGLAVAHARLGDPAVRAGTASGLRPKRSETAIELSYSHALADGIAVQPDLQYVINPGWEPGRRDALVAGVRFSFELFSR